MFLSIGAKIAVQESCPCNKVLKMTNSYFFFTKDNKAKQSTKQNVIPECIIIIYRINIDFRGSIRQSENYYMLCRRIKQQLRHFQRHLISQNLSCCYWLLNFEVFIKVYRQHESWYKTGYTVSCNQNVFQYNNWNYLPARCFQKVSLAWTKQNNLLYSKEVCFMTEHQERKI